MAGTPLATFVSPVLLPASGRQEVIERRRDAILALPQYTLVRIGSRPPGMAWVVGRIMYRDGPGLAPSTEGPLATLRNVTLQNHCDIDVLAVPAAGLPDGWPDL